MTLRLNREAATLAFLILNAIGIVALAERLGMKLRPWALAARKRTQP